MTTKPKILIINDDGIMAPGLKHLWQALVDAADVTIVAPQVEQSGVGLSITLREPIHIQKVEWIDKKTPAWSVKGTPADCVRMALGTILNGRPDLIVSGINRGSNSGRNIYYSGTVGGIIDGALRNVPGIAFSSVDFHHPLYETAAGIALDLVNHLLEHPLPPGTFLNVNVPSVTNLRGIQMATQGMGFWGEDLEGRVHPEGHPYYWMGGRWHEHEEHPTSDVSLLKEGFATAVPIHVHNMTHFDSYHNRKEQFDTLFSKPI
ncbi:MAG: 5'/3'-nucleotidase SurE [Verrucomicrobia bacterium]|nr:5'/3'-nucleotidase SurE [Verrucomicrobiota bacterium]